MRHPLGIPLLPALAVAASLWLGGTPRPAAAQTIDFEGLPDLTQVTSEFAAASGTFPGVTFAHTTVRTRDPFALVDEFPPHSGENIVFDEEGAISGVFTVPARTFGAYFTYNTRLTVTAYDEADNIVATILSGFTENFTSSASPPNELLRVTSAVPVKRFVIEGDPLGDSVAMDDFSASTELVPEPSSGVLFICALAAMCVVRHRLPTRRCRVPVALA